MLFDVNPSMSIHIKRVDVVIDIANVIGHFGVYRNILTNVYLYRVCVGNIFP